MIKLLQRLVAVVLFASAAAAQAAPMSPDPTGYWYNAGESGWGATIAQQKETLFVILFVYDEQKKPEWFVASSVRDTGVGVFTGTLYRMSGPWFGMTFDPAQVGSQAVGTLTVLYKSNFGGERPIQLSYTVNGVAVTKELARLTWDSNAERLPGAYFGAINYASLAAATMPAGCGAPPAFFAPGSEIRINMSAPDSIFIIHGTGIDTVEIIGGTYAQSGQLGTITGFLFGGNIVNPLKIADAQVTNLVVNDDGFLGHLRVAVGNCTYEGSIAATRR